VHDRRGQKDGGKRSSRRKLTFSMGFRKPTRSRCLIYHWGRAPRVHSFWSRHTLSIYQMLWYVIRTSHPEYARHRLISKALSIFRSTWRSSCRRHDAGLFQNPEYTNEQKLFGHGPL
jgi:hypothetical protein